MVPKSKSQTILYVRPIPEEKWPLKEAERSYSSVLKFTLPVTYDASKYPSTDGLQAVSEISSRLVFNPDAHILFLTPTRLFEVIEASRMNKALTKEGRRWYARGLLENEPVLKSIEKEFSEFCLKTSLTTLSFVGFNANDEEQLSIKEVCESENIIIIWLIAIMAKWLIF